ncbi:hypothetical protein DFH07DRAFT_774138 [Mycena maculata]|uniref:Uncharacterized protein n=1 Tax=Mycena maculata TaxID=230809 RepID=A0AAD7NB38_9AGAR|nr:hypothetical protein DFH07DRAFT_774138 [Mycena maculata]
MPPDRTEHIVQRTCAICPGGLILGTCPHAEQDRVPFGSQPRTPERGTGDPLPPFYQQLLTNSRSLESPESRRGVAIEHRLPPLQALLAVISIIARLNKNTDKSKLDPCLMTMGNDERPGSGDVFGDAPSEEPGSPKKKKKDRVRITNTNALHGLVEGARRGGQALDEEIPRMRKLRGPIENRGDSTRRFLRLVKDIMERCEQVSQETGCWLFFTAQHMFAKEPFLHYASPRIRKEGRKEVEEITNNFNRLFLTLIAARNHESKEMHRKLLAAEEKEADAQKELQAAREGEQRHEVEMAAAKAELEFYKAKLKLAGMN